MLKQNPFNSKFFGSVPENSGSFYLFKCTGRCLMTIDIEYHPIHQYHVTLILIYGRTIESSFSFFSHLRQKVGCNNCRQQYLYLRIMLKRLQYLYLRICYSVDPKGDLSDFADGENYLIFIITTATTTLSTQL